MKRSVKNILLSMLGFSAAPILTACYGMPEPGPDQYWNKDFKGKVTDTLGNPIKGIEVKVMYHSYDSWQLEQEKGCLPDITDAEGKFTIHVGQVSESACFVAEDIDGLENKHYYSAREQLLDFDGIIQMKEVAPAEEGTPDNEDTTNE